MKTLYTSERTEETTAEVEMPVEMPALRATRANTGKIARLPATVREELNQRLADGHEAAAIAAWINELPEVRDILSGRFDGRPINEENISRWRHADYAAWLERQQTRDAIKAMGAACGGFKRETTEELSERIGLVLFARLAAAVRRFDAMPEGEGKSAAWRDLLWGLALLRRGDFYAGKLRLDRERLQLSPAAQDAATRQAKPAMSTEEKQERIDQILGTGKYECRWDNAEKKMVGPGAPAYYEEAAIRARLRQEIDERKKAGTWPAENGAL